jgi:hypothetical protein
MKYLKSSVLFLPLALAVSWAASQPPPWQRGPGGMAARPVRERPEKLKVDLSSPPTGLVKNPRFMQKGPDGKGPADYQLQGDVAWTWCGTPGENTDAGVKFNSGKDLDGDGKRAGSVSQIITGFERGAGKWFRFTIRGMAESGFQVENPASDLFMRVEYFGNQGTNALDGVTQELYPLVELLRKDLATNGDYFKNGGAVWKTYMLDFRLPFAEIDTLKLSVGFNHGSAKSEKDADFYVSDFTLVPIPVPADIPKVVKTEKGPLPSLKSLLPLGGRWFYLPDPGITQRPETLIVNAKNATRLYYMDGQLSNPFAENMTAWLRKGNLDLKGNVVAKEQFIADNVVLEFVSGKQLVVHSRNLPNHPTARFPDPYGNGNPNSIQEIDRTYYLPLQPVRNPAAIAMDSTNSNRALPMGSIGVAINGVMFFNPFDAGGMEAVSIMDRCCGHPSPANEYHYHKYPVCVKSPFSDDGQAHSPLIGFALDGFPIYGPYEAKGLMAKDDKQHPIDAFNMHQDDERGWHYHVTPGRYPYIIGGFAGTTDPRNLRRGPPGGF